MRVGVDRNKYQIQIPLPPKIDPSVTMMTVEEKPDVTYNDVGGCKEQIEKMREVVELPMLSGVNLSRNMLARGHEWFGSFFRWHGQKKLASSFLMKLMQ
ncbi:26S PROTEASOME REGULATORY SUBUNIT [Salix koriyanagi]|uniref:26S PROTEASOME REGULATORY SUBUNIT n=1 Tax=Salix koriyanagi TaxID=2511006 RepID=A0A9Q0VBY2_9ROSI|nr:26S PROTEASOME REGULATORY SUBUNIT [Salix koriyanagi]